MAQVTSYASTVTTVDPAPLETADWVATGGTLTQAFGASSNGTTLYAYSDIDAAGFGIVSTFRVKFTGFDFSAIPPGSTINSVSFTIRARTVFAVVDAIVLPNFGGVSGGNTTHPLKFYNSSGGATINEYTDLNVCKYKVRVPLSNFGYQAITHELGAASDTAEETDNAVSFFTLANLQSSGLTAELGFYDEDQADESIRISAYGMFLVVDYTPPETSTPPYYYYH